MGAWLFLWSLTPLLWSSAGLVQAVVLVRSWHKRLCCFVLDVLLAAEWFWSYLLVSFVFFLAHFYFPASGHTSRGHR